MVVDFFATINFGEEIGYLFRDKGGTGGYERTSLATKTKGWLHRFPMHPLTVEMNGYFLTFTEAANTHFEPIFFSNSDNFTSIDASLRFSGYLPSESLESPWFAFILGINSAELLQHSHLVENLNLPLAISDTSWIKPGTIMVVKDKSTRGCKWAIDLVASFGIPYILLGPNWYGPENSLGSDPTLPVQYTGMVSLNVLEVIRYAAGHGIRVWLYVNDIALKRVGEKLFALYASWGVVGIKFGHFQLFTSQDNARLHRYIRLCAKHRLMVSVAHEYRPTGYSRFLFVSFPSLLSFIPLFLFSCVKSTLMLLWNRLEKNC